MQQEPIPAQAGMNRVVMYTDDEGVSDPRTGGDEPVVRPWLDVLVLRSPHRRG